jgi:hypothetical protein
MSHESKRTVQFKLEDITFFHRNEQGQLRCLLPCDAPFEHLLTADGTTLKLDNQKNGWGGVCVYQQHNGNPLHCPVRALARWVIHMRMHKAKDRDYLSTYFVNRNRSNVTAEDISRHLKIVAGILNYPTRKGIPVNRVNTHSLQGGGANALALSGYSNCQIQKMGWLRGGTFKEYIQEELANYSEGMSLAMKTKFNFMNIAGNAFSNITDTVLTMDYNIEFSPAAVA